MAVPTVCSDLWCQGPGICGKLLYLCLKHYNLASTTVTGIPMKEEQNASRYPTYPPAVLSDPHNFYADPDPVIFGNQDPDPVF